MNRPRSGHKGATSNFDHEPIASEPIDDPPGGVVRVIGSMVGFVATACVAAPHVAANDYEPGGVAAGDRVCGRPQGAAGEILNMLLPVRAWA